MDSVLSAFKNFSTDWLLCDEGSYWAGVVVELHLIWSLQALCLLKWGRNVLVHNWMSWPPALQGETTRRSAAATLSLLPVLHLTNLTKNLCKAAALLLPLPLRLIACQFDVKLLFCPFSPLFCHERYQICAILHHSFILIPIVFLHFWSLMKGCFSKIGFILKYFFFPECGERSKGW